MVRHVDPSDDSFRRSLLRAMAGGLAAMLVTFAITALLASVGRNDSGGPAVQSPSPSPAASVAVSQPPAPSEIVTEPPVEATEAATEEPDDPSTVTVQVLDTVGTGQGAAALEAAEVLRDLGYDVVAVNPTRRTADTTTVLATAGYRDEAEALLGQDDRFGEVRNNDGFSDEVDLHVIVAEDFAD